MLTTDHPERVGHALYGLDVDDALVPGAPFVIQPLVSMTYPSGGIGCQPSGDCVVAYARWVVESPYRNQRARSRVLFAAPEGVRCDADHECASAHCVDGVCCDDACGGGDPDDCLACSAASGGDVDGHCAPRAAASACASSGCSGLCDGAGACRLTCDAGIDAGPHDAAAEDAGVLPPDGDDAGPADGGASAPDAGSHLLGGGCSCPVSRRASAWWPWLVVTAAALACRRRRG
ncbi:hypothetical protein [Sandaracinus amylolyticus]|uniref:Tryptophan synthase alpha chain n=1 Tax=Sandaracinus amylolyticus TaxID=927083 RepID=A0A0F6W8H9_9BACT|nr:hypothetical protein [Sandaracinus amylolyticus]AKF10105.1 Tryptophan synthase alpha chain [Sandaracinus amylolyticus]